MLEVAIDEVVFVVSQVEGPNPSAVAIDIADVYLSTGPVDTRTASQLPPDQVRLHSPYPNPSSGGFTLDYNLATPAHVRLSLYDLLGRELLTLVDAPQPAGTQSAVVDASHFPAGLYFARLASGRTRSVVPLLIAR